MIAASPHPPMQKSSPRKPWHQILYIQVLIAVFIGILVGWFFPDAGKSLKPLGDGFVKLVKMIIAPIIFCTVAHGIASMSDMKRLGRIGLKAIVYFELVSTLALFIGLIVVNVMQPGAGFITLAATLAVVPSVPIQSLALIVGIDRFMSECRALTNFVGNGVATVVVSRWEKELSKEELRTNLRNALSLAETAAEDTANVKPLAPGT